MKYSWILIPLLFLTQNLLAFGWAGANSVVFTATPGTQTASAVTSTPLDDGTIYHIVQSNEALWSIALAYNVTVDQLKILNSLPTNNIYVGQKLLVKKPEILTATPEITITVTLGIPTSTATRPVTPTITSTATPLPTPPTSRQSGEVAFGVIVFVALLAASIGSWLGSKTKPKNS